jgi:hypothetical protein
MRQATILTCMLVSALAACGGGGDDSSVQVDAGLPNEGFVPPDHATMANMDDAEIGPADWSCLNTPTDDVATSVDLNLSGVVNDFQYMDNEVMGATVEAFAGIDHNNVLATDGPTDNTGAYTVTLPSGHTRWGFKISAPDYMDTFLLNQYFDDQGGTVADQTLNISGISEGVATALPAIIGLVRTPGTGVLAGAMRDCAGNEVSYAVATVSATSGQPDHLDGAVTYYLDSGAGLPVRHDQLNHTDTNGLFAVFELPATEMAYIQVWGFVDAADLADGQMTLLAELPAPVVGDTVVTGSINPLRTN